MMNCKKCGAELNEDNVTCIGLAQGTEFVPAALDIIIECPECESKLNGFLAIDSLIELED